MGGGTVLLLSPITACHRHEERCTYAKSRWCARMDKDALTCACGQAGQEANIGVRGRNAKGVKSKKGGKVLTLNCCCQAGRCSVVAHFLNGVVTQESLV